MRRNHTVSSLKTKVESVYEKIGMCKKFWIFLWFLLVAMEGSKSSIFAREKTPRAHSPVFKTRRNETDTSKVSFSWKDILIEVEDKETFCSMMNKYKVVSFDLGMIIALVLCLYNCL